MPQMEELTRLMRELEDQLVTCMKCGMCQSVCAVFEETGREADVARGKLALLDGLMGAMFDDPTGVYERLNKCLLCGSCAANCPSGVNVLAIFLKARTILTGYLGLPPAKRVLLRNMLAHPRRFDRIAEWGAKFQKIFTRPANTVIGTSCARVASPLLQNRHFKTLAQVPFHRAIAALDRPAGTSGLKVAFFTGCLIDKLYPEVARATLDVLDHHGVGVFIPADLGCCGIPAISGGDLSTFQNLVAHNVAKLKAAEWDYLVTACGTCTSTIHEIWPLMAAKDGTSLSAQVRRMAEKTMDINQFIVNQVGLSKNFSSQNSHSPSSAPVPVTYHDPCHLRKSLGVWTEPRDLIRANPNYTLQEMASPEQCCGMGGSFNLQYYEISSNIGRRKSEQIQQTGAAVVATGCPACMAQIADQLSRSGAAIAIKHPIELYAEALY